MATIRELLEQGRSRLVGLDSAQLDAEVLLCHVLQSDRGLLYARPEKRIGTAQQSSYARLISARCTGTPVAYLTGKKEFWSIELRVDEHTLVPRPETECLVEAALEHIPQGQALCIADLGTGSGAIAIALAIERPACRLLASDISAEALAVASYNARSQAIDQIRFVKSNWFSHIDERFEIIVSNPPYVADSDPHLGGTGVRHEPASALRGGHDGLDAIRCIIEGAGGHLTKGGWLFLEHGFDQAKAVSDLFRAKHYINVATRKDYAGLDRVTYGQYTG